MTSMWRHTQQAGLLYFQDTSAAAEASPVIFSSSRLIVFCTQSFDACYRDSTSVRGTGQFRSSEVANDSQDLPLWLQPPQNDAHTLLPRPVQQKEATHREEEQSWQSAQG